MSARIEVTFPEGTCVWLPPRKRARPDGTFEHLAGRWLYTPRGSKRPAPLKALPARIRRELDL